MKPFIYYNLFILFLIVGCDYEDAAIENSDQKSELVEKINWDELVLSSEEIDSISEIVFDKHDSTQNLIELRKSVIKPIKKVYSDSIVEITEYIFEFENSEITYTRYESIDPVRGGILYENEFYLPDSILCYFEFRNKKIFVKDLFDHTNADRINWNIQYLILVGEGKFVAGIYSQCDACSEFDVESLIVDFN